MSEVQHNLRGGDFCDFVHVEIIVIRFIKWYHFAISRPTYLTQK